MASEIESSCEEDPNFAVICAFFEKFGSLLGITDIDICELQSMLENTHEVSKNLVELHVKLLRKIKKTVHPERWEKSIVKFGHSFSSKDAWEIERFGYKNAKVSTKVKILKEILEAQFDLNTKFKTEINKLTSLELRSQPLGRDKFGHAYWFQSDDNYQIRVFKEDLDDEKWSLVAKDREGLVSLINTLSDGDIKISSDSAGNEDSNSLSEKPIIDTGQQDTDSKKTSDDENFSTGDSTQNKEDDKSNEQSSIFKKPRAETDDGTIFQKYNIKNLEIRVSKISENPVVGDAIEEPVLKIQGEGSGEENKCPIIGVEIEEEILYFYGHGSGHDCQTGNQPEEENDQQTDCPSKEATKTIESEKSENSTSEQAKTFFFGNSKNSLKEISAPTMAFGTSSLDKDNNEYPNKVEERVEVDNTILGNIEPKITRSTEQTEKSEIKSVIIRKENDVTENSEKKNINIDKQELVVAKDKEIMAQKDFVETKSLTEQTENIEKEIISIDKQELVVAKDKEIKTHKDFVKTKLIDNPVTEPICIKKTAYICGENIETDLETKKAENDNIAVVEKQQGDEEQSVVKDKLAENKTINQFDVVNSEHLVLTDKKELKNDVENDDRKMKSEVTILDNQPENEKETERCEVKAHLSELKTDLEPIDKQDKIQREVVFVSENSRYKNQSERILEGEKKSGENVGRRTTKIVSKAKSKAPKKERAEHNIKVVESPTPNSPSVSVGENSDISMGDIAAESGHVDVPEADPLAVSGSEGDSKAAAVTGNTLSSFSLDFNDSPKQVNVPALPSPMRAVRKRGRELACPKSPEGNTGNGKRMKLKGRRSVDTALRKSVEQRIEQLNASSSESKESDAEDISSKKTSRPKKKQPKRGVKKSSVEEEPTPTKTSAKRNTKKNSRILAGLNINEDSSNDRPVLRQSRRLAQIKIKEQFGNVYASTKIVAEEEGKKKKTKVAGNDDKPDKRKRDKKTKDDDVSEPEIVIERKKKKKKEKPISRIFNENRPWQSSTEDSEDVAEEEEEEEIIEEEDVPLGDLKSDHEFSPESDLEDDNDEYQPMKRARTAKKESDQEDVDEFPCQKCGKDDHPEWILLCDKCDSGWHCSCLRPPLLVIPEGDWFCPPCQHINLLEQLQVKLVEYDKKLSKKEVEDRRKERLAYVGISLNNVLPSKENTVHKKKNRRHSMSGSNTSSSYSEESQSESASDSDEPIYQLRQRRQAKNYKFNEYDEMMKTAIGEDTNKPEDTAGNLGRGKDIQTIVKGLEPEPEEKKGDDGDRPSVTNLKKMLRKKHRKLNSLEFDSEEEDISDEDFKGSSDESEEEEDEEEPEESEDSDDYVGRKRRKYLPVRRSTRARTKRYDTDFVNDDSEDEPPRRKKKKSIWDESDTEESDISGYGRKNKGRRTKNKKKDFSDDEPIGKKNRPRIKYGGLTSSEEEELGRGRRTRGKKTTYIDTLGSDSDEDTKPKKSARRIETDDEDFVANEDEIDEDEKESEGKEEPEENEESEQDSEQERREKRSLLVPKIYIKKPLGSKKQKELEPAKVMTPNEENETVPSKDPENIEFKHKNQVPFIENKKEAQELKESQPLKSEPGESSNEQKREKVSDIANQEIRCEQKCKVENDPEETCTNFDDNTEAVDKNLRIPMMDSTIIKISDKKSRESDVVHEPIISNVNALFKNDDENDDLSEPPGISLPLFHEMPLNSPDAQKKRRKAPGKKKSLEESLSSIGTRISPVKSSQPAIEIAAPPLPFSQAHPTPSVITRMLQSKPGISIYPVGRIRPKQFATMRDDDSDDSNCKEPRALSPGTTVMSSPNQFNKSDVPRESHTKIDSYHPHGPHPSLNHFSRGSPPFRGTPPQQEMITRPYSHHPSHRSLDPSPSGGGPINLAEPKPLLHSGGVVRPGKETSGQRGLPANRFAPLSHSNPTVTRPNQQSFPPPPVGNNGPPNSPQRYHSPSVQNDVHTPQPYHPPSNPNKVPLIPQPPYHTPPISSNGPPIPQQSYLTTTPSNDIPSQQTYPIRNHLGNGHPPLPQTYPSPLPSSNDSHHQPYSPRLTSSNGPHPSVPKNYSSSSTNKIHPPQQPYPPRPNSNNESSQSTEVYYGNRSTHSPDESVSSTPYQGMPPEGSSPYRESYSSEELTPAIEPANDTSRTHEEESGGEFAGLASYFSSQRDDDLDS